MEPARPWIRNLPGGGSCADMHLRICACSRGHALNEQSVVPSTPVLRTMLEGLARSQAAVRAARRAELRPPAARHGVRPIAPGFSYGQSPYSTNIMDFRGFDSSIILILRGGIRMSIGDFPECLSHAILVGIMLVGRLGVAPLLCPPWEGGRGAPSCSRHALAKSSPIETLVVPLKISSSK